jgi:hypothetical protein
MDEPQVTGPKNAVEAKNLVANLLIFKLDGVEQELNTDIWTPGQLNRLRRARDDVKARLEKLIKPHPGAAPGE